MQRLSVHHPHVQTGAGATALIDDQAGNRQEAKQVYEKILAFNSFFTPASKNLAALRSKETKAQGFGTAINLADSELSESNHLDLLGIGPMRSSDSTALPSADTLLPPGLGLPGTNSVP